MGQNGCSCLARRFHVTGEDLLLSTNERMFRKIGIPMRKASALMSTIVDLRLGAWGQPEPPLGKVPLETVAMRAYHSNPKWVNVVEDPDRRAVAAYHPKAIDDARASWWFQMLSSKLDWRDLSDAKYQEEGKKIPRRTVFVVNEGCNCVYAYSGVKVPPTVEPDFLKEIRETCAAIAGISEADMPNSCNINLYRNGDDSVGWHTDNEQLFEAEDIDACILSLSLGASRKFQVKPQNKTEVGTAWKTFVLHHGDLATMEGKFQRHYLHAVPKEPRVSEPRINLTWRWITQHNRQSGCQIKGVGN